MPRANRIFARAWLNPTGVGRTIETLAQRGGQAIAGARCKARRADLAYPDGWTD